MVDFTLAHWIYLLGTLVIILTMLWRKNVVVPAIVATFMVAWIYTNSFVTGMQATFKASLVAASALFDIFLIIAVMTALLHALKEIDADQRMIMPFQKVMVNGHISFWILILVTYVISLFFWPTPAVPLVGAILLPVAIRAGLPPIGAAMAIALAGQGMALSSDYIIQIAPMLSATAGQLETSAVADRALLLSLITGGIAILLAYWQLRKKIKSPADEHLIQWQNEENLLSEEEKQQQTEAKATVERNKGVSFEADSTEQVAHSVTFTQAEWKGKLFAVIVPVAFLSIVCYMLWLKFFNSTGEGIQGGDGAAFIGGAALLLLIAATLTKNAAATFENVSKHIIAGLLFAFKAMGVVLPIAGFFFLGSGESSGQILSLSGEAPTLLFDLVQGFQAYIPDAAILTGLGMLLIGMITGLDGSGFSGLPLTGALAAPLGQTAGLDPITLAAIGQMGAVWVGGGTLVAWSSLVAVAGFAKVSVMELVRKNFVPVLLGLLISTIFGIIFLS